MRTIIAGSRGINDHSALMHAIVSCGFKITEVVSGGARGVDSMGEAWADGAGIPIKRFIPDWDGLGRKAGILRNGDMVAYCDAAIILWDGTSRGTLNTINRMKAAGKPCHVSTP